MFFFIPSVYDECGSKIKKKGTAVRNRGSFPGPIFLFNRRLSSWIRAIAAADGGPAEATGGAVSQVLSQGTSRHHFFLNSGEICMIRIILLCLRLP